MSTLDHVMVGRRIKAARQLVNLTTQQLADAVDIPGLGFKTIGSIERGGRALRPHEVAPLAEALAVPPDFLTGAAAADGRRDGHTLAACLRQGADELEKAHAVLDTHGVPRSIPGSNSECTLAARIALALS